MFKLAKLLSPDGRASYSMLCSYRPVFENLTILENIFLEATSRNISFGPKDQFVKKIQTLGIKNLDPLIQILGDLELRPINLSAKKQFVLSLLQNLLKNFDYLFIDWDVQIDWTTQERESLLNSLKLDPRSKIFLNKIPSELTHLPYQIISFSPDQTLNFQVSIQKQSAS
jgi:hypothetical protein